MRTATKQKLFQIVLVLEDGKKVTVNAKGSSEAVACNRALKRTKGAVSVKEVL